MSNYNITWNQSSPLCSTYTGIKLNSAKTNLKTMTGTTAYLLINHSTIEGRLTNSFMSLKSANITIKSWEKVATSSAYSPTPLLKDCIIPISIKPISVSSFWKRKNNVIRISCVLLCIWLRRKEILSFARTYFFMKPTNKNYLCVWETP